MTHSERLQWLASHGWRAAIYLRDVDLHKDGCRWVWLDGSKGKMRYSAWMCWQDGRVKFDGCSAMPWEQFCEWLAEPVQPVVQPAKRQARSLFDD